MIIKYSLKNGGDVCDEIGSRNNVGDAIVFQA